jgi:hypothetical protein
MRHGLIGTAVLSAFLIFNPTMAGQIIIPGEGGTEDPPPDPGEGGESEENWNPVVTCVSQPGDTILDLLVCLQNLIENPPPPCSPQTTGGGGGGGPIDFDQDPPHCYDYPMDRSDFTVTIRKRPPDAYWGIDIFKLDGSEIERLAFRETHAGIQTTELYINKPSRMASVGHIIEEPAGDGAIILKVDGIPLTFPTEGLTAFELNQTLEQSIAAIGGGYRVYDDGIQFHIFKRTGKSPGVRRIHFRSTDSGILRSSLALGPDPGTEW